MLPKRCQLLFLRLVLEIQRGRVHAVAQAGVGGTVGKDMAQMGSAVAAHSLGAYHAVAAVHDIGDGAGQGLVKAGPAAAGVKLGMGVEQLVAAADAVIAAIGPELLVFAGERPLGGSVARDLEGRGFGALVLQQGLPFLVGFLDREAHDEQLISIEEAQSGGKPAQSAWSGCDS
ncbi:hypothetical protein SDC9_154844 [bioreactor metagenome]|uniref:Uncharacterized protein n=1 Tax=bioreactor metagenome TaxID=1076179 RepID=A0A645F4T6_9ZZZZ